MAEKAAPPDSIPGKRTNPRSLIIFFIVFVLVLIFTVYYFSEIKKEIKLLEKVNIFWLLLAIFSQFMTYFFTAITYRILLHTQRLQDLPGIWNLVKASVISLFFNQTMPAAGISGNTYYFSFLSRMNFQVTQIISLILTELLIFYAAMELIIITLMVTCLFFYQAPSVFAFTFFAGSIVYLVFGTLITLAGRKKFIHHSFEKIQRSKWLKKIFARLIQKIQQQGLILQENNYVILKTNMPAALKALLFQFGVLFADGMTLYALFYGVGVPVSPVIVLMAMMGTKIISILPFLPGALVLYESSMCFFFVRLGIPLATAIIVTLVYRLLAFWFPMPLGLFLYRRWQKKSADSLPGSM